MKDSANLNHSRAFLKMLDPKTEAFCFRVLPEAPSCNAQPIKLHATLEAKARTLEKQNQQGCGVFVVINQGGHDKASITQIRALFADTDGAPLEPILNQPCKPHMVIESSPDRWHAYWLIEPSTQLDLFPLLQTAIAQRFGTDTAVKDLPRLMRLPGFYHCKSHRFLSKIVKADPCLPKYQITELANLLELDLSHLEQPRLEEASSHQDNAQHEDLRVQLVEVERALRYLDPNTPYDKWIRPILAIAHEFGEDGRGLAHKWSKGDLWKGDQND